MGTSVTDGWPESSRPELWTACRLRRPTDDRSTRANHPDPFVLCSAAVDEERIPGNPAIRVLKRKRGQTEDEARKVTTLTEELLSRVLRAADEHCPDHADAIYLLAWTGLRISEACGLQWGDLDLGGHFLSVN